MKRLIDYPNSWRLILPIDLSINRCSSNTNRRANQSMSLMCYSAVGEGTFLVPSFILKLTSSRLCVEVQGKKLLKQSLLILLKRLLHV